MTQSLKKWRKKQMKLTKSNYFSLEAGIHYMSVSQFKDFVPSLNGCEARAYAKVQGLYEQKSITAFAEGHYVHAWNECALEEFKANNPDLYSSRGKTAGELKSNFQHCNTMIEVLENDPMCMLALSGEKEIILTAELFGIPWKIMIDSYNPSRGVFADLKALKAMDGKFWDNDERRYKNFLEHYGYIIQMAVYAEVERLNKGRGDGEWLIPHIVIVTKEAVPDHEIIYFDHGSIEEQLSIVAQHIERVKAVKSGQENPIRCEKCDYCKSTKKIEKIKHYTELEL